MIIQGHPDILRGPQGLNGLHGFGSLPPEGSSPAYIRFLTENGGAGIEALYQEIRDFINTPGRTDAEIEQAKMASGVSDRDVQNAFQVPGEKFVDTKEDYTFEKFCPPGSHLVGGSCVGLGGPEIYNIQINAAIAAKAAVAEFVAKNAAKGVAVNQRDLDLMELNYYAELVKNSLFKDEVLSVVEPSPAAPPVPSAQEIRDFVSNNSQADILAAMARTGVTQSDIIRAFKEVDAALPTGQSPAFRRYLPENGGLGLEVLYKEINDYANTHSFYELLAQMQRSGVSMKDVDAANSYAFEKQQAQSPAEYAAANAGEVINTVYHGDGSYTEYYRDGSYYTFGISLGFGVKSVEEAIAERAKAAADKAAGILSNEEKFNAKYQARIVQEQAIQKAALEKEMLARQAAAAAAAAPTKVFTATGQSPAYTRFLPENGGKGITALYKEISDFVGTHSNAQIQTAMTASGVSEVDVINALQVFPNKPIVKTTETVTAAKDTGLALPLVVSAIAAYFVLG